MIDGDLDPQWHDKPYPRPPLPPHPDIARLIEATNALAQAQYDTQVVYRNLTESYGKGQRMALILAFTVFAYVPATLAAVLLPVPALVHVALWLAALACIVTSIIVALRLRRARLALTALFTSLPGLPTDGQPAPD